MRIWIATLSCVAGLYGAAGVALAAVAAHRVADATLMTAAHFLLFQAPGLVALCVAAHVTCNRLTVAAATGIAFGTLLFSGDLALRALGGVTLVRMAAPTGGVLMILGWLLAAGALPLTLGRHTNERRLNGVINKPQTNAAPNG